MKIYVVIKAAKEQMGEWVMCSTEAAFKDQAQAQAYLKNLPVVWEETLNEALCYCERAIHEVELI